MAERTEVTSSTCLLCGAFEHHQTTYSHPPNGDGGRSEVLCLRCGRYEFDRNAITAGIPEKVGLAPSWLARRATDSNEPPLVVPLTELERFELSQRAWHPQVGSAFFD